MRSKRPRFVKYTSISAGCSIRLAEMLFILHAAGRVPVPSQPGGRWSKKFLMKKMGLGEKVFDRCVRRLSKEQWSCSSSPRTIIPSIAGIRLCTNAWSRYSATDNLEASWMVSAGDVPGRKRCIQGYPISRLKCWGRVLYPAVREDGSLPKRRLYKI